MYAIFEIIPIPLSIDLLFPQIKDGKQIRKEKREITRKKFGKSK